MSPWGHLFCASRVASRRSPSSRVGLFHAVLIPSLLTSKKRNWLTSLLPARLPNQTHRLQTPNPSPPILATHGATFGPTLGLLGGAKGPDGSGDGRAQESLLIRSWMLCRL